MYVKCAYFGFINEQVSHTTRNEQSQKHLLCPIQSCFLGTAFQLTSGCQVVTRSPLNACSVCTVYHSRSLRPETGLSCDILITINIPGKHEVNQLQKTAILGAAHILRKVLM